MATKKKGSGGKLNRSEIIQTRLSPKSRYAAELMARIQKRTLSSLIEQLVEEAAKHTKVDITPPYESESKRVTMSDAVNAIWDNKEHVRFVALAINMPDLLTADEECIWSLIAATSYFWAHYQIDLTDEQGNVIGKQWQRYELIPEHLEEYWEKITCGKPFNIGQLPRDIGRKTARPEHFPASRRSFLEPKETRELVFEGDDFEFSPEVLDLWMKEVIAHSTETTEVKQTKNGKKTIKKFWLPSLEIQAELMQKAIKIKKEEKKHGA